VRKRIILDTNALIAPFQFNFNLDLELNRVIPWAEPIVPSSVVKELKKLSGSGDWKIKAALKLAENYEKVEVKGKGDPSIIALAVRESWPVMTQDRRLRARLNDKGIIVVLVREKGHLQLFEP
jgi:rRNA-processing protein FCF1